MIHGILIIYIFIGMPMTVFFAHLFFTEDERDHFAIGLSCLAWPIAWSICVIVWVFKTAALAGNEFGERFRNRNR